jgi:hypothetical protein
MTFKEEDAVCVSTHPSNSRAIVDCPMQVPYPTRTLGPRPIPVPCPTHTRPVPDPWLVACHATKVSHPPHRDHPHAHARASFDVTC